MDGCFGDRRSRASALLQRVCYTVGDVFEREVAEALNDVQAVGELLCWF